MSMNMKYLVIIAAIALTGCGARGPTEYVTVDQDVIRSMCAQVAALKDNHYISLQYVDRKGYLGTVSYDYIAELCIDQQSLEEARKWEMTSISYDLRVEGGRIIISDVAIVVHSRISSGGGATVKISGKWENDFRNDIEEEWRKIEKCAIR